MKQRVDIIEIIIKHARSYAIELAIGKGQSVHVVLPFSISKTVITVPRIPIGRQADIPLYMRAEAVSDVRRPRSGGKKATQQCNRRPPDAKFCDEVGDFDVQLDQSMMRVIASHFNLPRAIAAWPLEVEVVKYTADGSHP
ncbi:hypothetical protein [Cognatishimia maritima]|uniref:hypothetical protein n=1 Tax=Cognatishimia maritima TaxID=870908 RepID=UPI0010427330|nr:hypothetical protein [Cognatishimia maritima]